MDDGQVQGASLRDRAGGATAPEPASQSQPKALIPSAGALKVWWVPQVPMAPFEAVAPDLATAAAILDVLSDYDAYQFRTNVKGDYCNAGGLMILCADGEWEDWETEDGDDFDRWRDENLPRFPTNGWRDRDLTAQAIEARRAETSGSACESPVLAEDAPDTSGTGAES
jgi:hypothetical protein